MPFLYSITHVKGFPTARYLKTFRSFGFVQVGLICSKAIKYASTFWLVV